MVPVLSLSLSICENRTKTFGGNFAAMLFQLKYAKTRAHINQEDVDVPYPSTIRLSNPGSFDLQLHVKNKACPLSVWHVVWLLYSPTMLEQNISLTHKHPHTYVSLEGSGSDRSRHGCLIII